MICNGLYGALAEGGTPWRMAKLVSPLASLRIAAPSRVW